MTQTCLRIVDPSNVVHASSYEEYTIWGPGQVINLRTGRPAHVLDTPSFLIICPVLPES